MKDIFSNKSVLAALLLIAVCLFSYGNVFHYGFLLDDGAHFFEKGNLGEISFKDLWTQAYYGHYRPFGRLFGKMLVTLSGENPVGYHLIHLIGFLGICFLIYHLIRHLAGSHELALLTSCLFAAHPIQNVLVVYKVTIGVCVYTILMLSAALMLIRFAKEGDRKYYAFTLVLYFLSLLCHEIAFMLPVYLFLMLSYLGKFNLKKNLMLSLGYAVPFLIYYALRYSIIGTAARKGFQGSIFELGLTFNQYLNTNAHLLYWYFSKLFVPVDIVSTWDERIAGNSFVFWNVLFFTVITVAFVFGFWKIRKNFKAFSLCFFISGFIPLGLASFVYTQGSKTAIIKPYWLVFTSIGFFVLIAGFLLQLKKFLNRKMLLSILAVIVVSLSIATRKSNSYWQDAETYCTYWSNLDPDNLAAWICRAKADIEKFDRGLDKTKYVHCDEVSELAAAYNLARERGKALQYYQMALEMDENCITAYYGLGLLAENVKDYPNAESAFLKAISIDRNFYPAYEQLYRLYGKQGRLKEAVKIQEILNRLPPGSN